MLAHLSISTRSRATRRVARRATVQAAPLRIREALEALRLLRAEDRTEARVAAAVLARDVRRHPGDPVLVRSRRRRGHQASGDRLDVPGAIERSRRRTGRLLNHGDYEALKRRWPDLALERGYADAQVHREPHRRLSRAARRRHRAALRLGTSATRSATSTSHQDVLSDELIALLHAVPGRATRTTARELTTLYVALANSGYFRNIEVRPLAADREAGEIPVDIVLTGARAATDQLRHRLLDRHGPARSASAATTAASTSAGHQFGVNAQLSPVMSEFTANYRMPYRRPAHRMGRRSTPASSARTPTRRRATASSSACAVCRPPPRNWTRTQLLSLLIEDFAVGAQVGPRAAADARHRLDEDSRRQQHPAAHRVEALAARAVRGRRARSDNELRASGPARQMDLVHAEESRFIVRGELGAMAERSFEELPPSVRFFAGGDNSVRGYDYEALGPDGRDGPGHRRLVARDRELRVRASCARKWPNWSVAAFVDSGNAFERSTFDAKTGAGFGARWLSPLGPIRVDSPIRSTTRRRAGGCTSSSGRTYEVAGCTARSRGCSRSARSPSRPWPRFWLLASQSGTDWLLARARPRIEPALTSAGSPARCSAVS